MQCNDLQPSAKNDDSYVALLRENDESAFRTLFERYDQPLTVFATRMLHSQDRASDVVQDVFVRLWNDRARLTIHGSVKAYLYAAVRNKVLDTLKRDKIEQRWRAAFEGSGGSPGMGIAARNPAERLELQELEVAMQAAIALLPERARQIATLRWYDRLSRMEIADIMGIAVGTVNKQLTLSARAMRDRLKLLRP